MSVTATETYLGYSGLERVGISRPGHGLLARDGSGALFIHQGVIQTPPLVQPPEDLSATSLPDVHKKPSRSFDLRRIFAFPSYGKSKRTKECVVDDQQPRFFDNDFLNERILDTDLSQLVFLPSHVDLNEWLASHVVSFVENINLIYGCLSEYCLASTCTTMNGPNNTKYLWLDDRNRKCKCSAPQYIDYVMSFCHQCIYDETVFPTKYGNSFPVTFLTTVQKICRLLFHVLAHLYHSHSSHLHSLHLADCLNTTSHHFLIFVQQFNLVDSRELEPLRELLQRLGERTADPRVCFPSAEAAGDARSEARSIVETHADSIVQSPTKPTVEHSTRSYIPTTPSASAREVKIIDGGVGSFGNQVAINGENTVKGEFEMVRERDATFRGEVGLCNNCCGAKRVYNSTGFVTKINNYDVLVNQINLHGEAMKQCNNNLTGCQINNEEVHLKQISVMQSNCDGQQSKQNTDASNQFMNGTNAKLTPISSSDKGRADDSAIISQLNNKVTQVNWSPKGVGEQRSINYPDVVNQTNLSENAIRQSIYYDDFSLVKQPSIEEEARLQSSGLFCGEEKPTNARLRTGSRENKENLKLDSVESHCKGLTSIGLIASI